MFTFVELEPFARARENLLDDAEFTRLQFHLMAEPEAGHPGIGRLPQAALGCERPRQTRRGTGDLFSEAQFGRNRAGDDVCQKRAGQHQPQGVTGTEAMV